MPLTGTLFPLPSTLTIAPEVTLFRGLADSKALKVGILEVAAAAPFRHLMTRGGAMSVAMTNCGDWGWHSDARGYRYVDRDPESGARWPSMPLPFRALAIEAAARAGFAGFDPDACLVNRYAVGARMGTHRDFDERDFRQPIVSVSIGLPATFVWFGDSRRGSGLPVSLEDGDVLVWGGAARAGYHAVRTVVASATAPAANALALRFNLTFRRAR